MREFMPDKGMNYSTPLETFGKVMTTLNQYCHDLPVWVLDPCVTLKCKTYRENLHSI